MNRKWINVIVVIAAAGAMVALGVHGCQRRADAMRTLLEEVRAFNRADSTFTDSRDARTLVDYYCEPLRFWVSTNDRMESHYLLGRAYADMGESPKAIAEYLEAVECADTTSADCDLRTLRAVYGQMANVFHQQNLPQDEIRANSNYTAIARLMKDTLQIGIGLENLTRPYYLMGDTTNLIRTAETAADIFYSIGRRDKAANALSTVAFIEAQRGHIEKAQHLIELIRRESTIFDSLGNLRPGREMFYYTIGLYFENSNLLDSAEYYYRKLIPAHRMEAAYRGLLSVYEKQQSVDSIGKYARLFADANDAMHNDMRTEAVIHATKNYQYARNERLAHLNEEKAKRRQQLVYGLLTIVLFLTFLSFYIYRHHRFVLQQKIQELSIISSSLAANQEKLTNDKNELALLNKNHQQLILVKQNEIDLLLAEKQELQNQYRRLEDSDKRTAYYNSDIIKKIRSSCLTSSQPDPLSDDDWQLAFSLFSQTYPSFVDFVKSRTRDFSDNEWKIVLLTDLAITSGDMAKLISTSSARVSQLKVQIAHVLFDRENANSLAIILKELMSGKI